MTEMFPSVNAMPLAEGSSEMVARLMSQLLASEVPEGTWG